MLRLSKIIYILAAEGASSRLNTAQAFNSLGTTLAPLIGGWLIFKNAAPDAAVRLPYVSLAVILSLIAVLMWFTKLPEPRHQEKVSKSNALGYPQLRFGMVAIFCYVGAEVAIGSLIINFLGMSDILHLPEGSAKHYLSLYWGGAMTGRFLGALALSKTMSTTQRYGGMLLIGAMMFGLLYSLNSSEHFMFDHIWPLAALITANIAAFVLAGPNPSRALGLFASVASGLLLGAIFLHGCTAWRSA